VEVDAGPDGAADVGLVATAVADVVQSLVTGLAAAEEVGLVATAVADVVQSLVTGLAAAEEVGLGDASVEEVGFGATMVEVVGLGATIVEEVGLGTTTEVMALLVVGMTGADEVATAVAEEEQLQSSSAGIARP